MDFTGKEIVIFDTNAYRYLVSKRSIENVEKFMDRMIRREHNNGITALASPMVLREMLAHVTSKKDKAFESSLKAIKAAYIHTGDKNHYRMIADYELLICKAVFNVELHNDQIKLGNVAYQLTIKDNLKVLRNEQAFLLANQQYIKSSEKNFQEAVKVMIKKIDPSAQSWRIFGNNPKLRSEYIQYIDSPAFSLGITYEYLLALYVKLLKAGLITPLSVSGIQERMIFFIQAFAAPIELWKEVFRRMANGEFDPYLSKNANFIWDIQLMFSVGNHSISNAKIMVVSTDKAMGRAAQPIRAQFNIYTYNEYMEYLGLDQKS